MNTKRQILAISNESVPLLLLFFEPFGEDYYLKHGETFQLIAEGAKDNFYFQVDVNSAEQVTVWEEGDAESVRVFCKDEELQCGYNRPPHRES